jgi:hypothetical protein
MSLLQFTSLCRAGRRPEVGDPASEAALHRFRVEGGNGRDVIWLMKSLAFINVHSLAINCTTHVQRANPPPPTSAARPFASSCFDVFPGVCWFCPPPTWFSLSHTFSRRPLAGVYSMARRANPRVCITLNFCVRITDFITANTR